MVMIMILADKIALHRKNAGWSQEEFAYKMNVSRQAVSKWEQAQSTPDLDKILLMAKLFGVTTDYLLKDTVEEPEFLDYDEVGVRRISMQEAHTFLDVTESIRKPMAFGVALVILSPISVLLLEKTHVEIGLTILILMVAVAVFLFIVNGLKFNQYEYLEKEVFELEYGVESMILQKMEQYRSTYISLLAGGVILCIVSIIPVFLSEMLPTEELGVVLLLMIVSCGTYLLVSNQLKWSAFKKLLQQDDYDKKHKKANSLLEPIAGVYWTLATALYLFISFTKNNWAESWIIWPVAGVLFATISIIVTSFEKSK